MSAMHFTKTNPPPKLWGEDPLDLEYRRVTNETACELAQRCFDVAAGLGVPVAFREALERVVGAPFNRLQIYVDRHTGRVESVVVLSIPNAMVMAFSPLHARKPVASA